MAQASVASSQIQRVRRLGPWISGQRTFTASSSKTNRARRRPPSCSTWLTSQCSRQAKPWALPNQRAGGKSSPLARNTVNGWRVDGLPWEQL